MVAYVYKHHFYFFFIISKCETLKTCGLQNLKNKLTQTWTWNQLARFGLHHFSVAWFTAILRGGVITVPPSYSLCIATSSAARLPG